MIAIGQRLFDFGPSLLDAKPMLAGSGPTSGRAVQVRAKLGRCWPESANLADPGPSGICPRLGRIRPDFSRRRSVSDPFRPAGQVSTKFGRGWPLWEFAPTSSRNASCANCADCENSRQEWSFHQTRPGLGQFSLDLAHIRAPKLKARRPNPHQTEGEKAICVCVC